MSRLIIDFRLDTPGFEISALKSSIGTLERQLEEIKTRRTRDVERFVAGLDHSSEEDYAEAQFAYQELEWEVEHTYPRVYRGALLLLVWAAYESGVQEVAEFIQKRLSVSLGLSDIRGRTALERATKYFPEVLKFQLFASTDSLSRLREIELVRNAFAHANGNLRRTSESGRKALDAMVKAGRLEEGWGLARPTKGFLDDALKLVGSEVESLVQRAKAWDDQRRPPKS
jgi:hypothetical protein